MSTGSTGSTFPKWQLAVLIGAPVALGLGYLYWRRSSDLEDGSGDGTITKKTLKDIKDKTISIDGDDKSKKSESGRVVKEPESPLEQAQQYKNEGNAYFKKAKYDDAIKFYDKAIEVCPPTAEHDLSTFYQNRAAAYEQLRKYISVIEDCTKAIDLNPKYLKALHRRAKAFEQTKEFAKCLEDTTATCILEGFQNKSTLVLADRVLKELGRQHAKEAMSDKKAVEPSKFFVKNYITSFSNDPLRKIEINSENPRGFARAQMLFHQEKYDEVIAACTEEIESSEADAEHKMEATLLRATFYLLTGQFAEAGIDLAQVIDNSEADAGLRSNALIKRASLYMQTEKPEECFTDFAEAETIDPTNGDVYHHRGQVFTLLEKLEDAVEDFKKACKLNPESGVTFVHKCYAEYRLAFQNQDQFQAMEAMKQFEQATVKYPNCVECYSMMAQVLTDQQQFQEADNYFDKASKIEPTNAQLSVHRGLLLLQWKGDITKAIELIRKAIEIDDKCEFAYETLGTIEVQRGNLDEAVNLFEKAILLAKSEMELMHLYSLKDAAIAQINVTKKLNIDVASFLSQQGLA